MYFRVRVAVNKAFCRLNTVIEAVSVLHIGALDDRLNRLRYLKATKTSEQALPKMKHKKTLQDKSNSPPRIEIVPLSRPKFLFLKICFTKKVRIFQLCPFSVY